MIIRIEVEHIPYNVTETLQRTHVNFDLQTSKAGIGDTSVGYFSRWITIETSSRKLKGYLSREM